jgi:hypothetical protein
MKPDWNKYRETFPNRYWGWGEIDKIIQDQYDLIGPKTILDVGGGAYGTDCLRNMVQRDGVKMYLCDPNIEKCPDWMVSNISLSLACHQEEKFDLVIMRGSLNFLMPWEIRQAEYIGKNLIANTFRNCPSDRWEARNNGDFIELYRSLRKQYPAVIENILVKDDNTVIEHSFYYYSEKELKDSIPGVSFHPYGVNSVALIAGENDG